MSYKIEKNTYVQPTKVREDVVQMLLDYILEECMDKMTGGLTIIQKESVLYFCPTTNHKVRNIKYPQNEMDGFRMRTCEMKELFNVFQDTGYYILCCITNDHYGQRNECYSEQYHYYFSTKPYLMGHKCERIDFNNFID